MTMFLLVSRTQAEMTLLEARLSRISKIVRMGHEGTDKMVNDVDCRPIDAFYSCPLSACLQKCSGVVHASLQTKNIISSRYW